MTSYHFALEERGLRKFKSLETQTKYMNLTLGAKVEPIAPDSPLLRPYASVVQWVQEAGLEHRLVAVREVMAWQQPAKRLGYAAEQALAIELFSDRDAALFRAQFPDLTAVCEVAA
jgi:hypothetical protein